MPARLGALATTTAALTLAGATGAAAHVSVSPGDGEAGSYTVLTFSVPHGCEGSPTTAVAIQIPEPILSVTPTRNPLWDVEKVMTRLAEPVTDAHGNEVTERVEQVVYTAKEPLSEGYRDAFELSLQLPDTPGETLAFPSIQTCEQGETAWTELAAEGQDPHDLDAPAPLVTVVEAADGHEGQQTATEETADGGEVQDTSATTDVKQDTVTLVALVAGVLGLLAGATALVQVRRRA